MKSVKLPSLCCVFSDHSQSDHKVHVQQHQVSETASLHLKPQFDANQNRLFDTRRQRRRGEGEQCK